MTQQFDSAIYPREIGAYVCWKKCVSMFIEAFLIITPNNHSSLIHDYSNLGAMSDIWEMSVCKEITTVALSHLKKFNNNSLITQNIKCLHLVIINAVFK